MHFLIYFIILFGTWISYFLIYLHCDWSWLLPAYSCITHVKSLSEIDEVYDYIIVGAGTAGSVIAHRLSQNTSQKILLVEAGPLGSPLLDIPGALALLQLSAVDWNFKTTPQANAAFSLNERRSNWPRGKLVGGTGRLNNMIFIRGHPQDYLNWFSQKSPFQNDTKELLNFLKYYWKRSENQQGIYKNDTEWHGVNGPLIASDLRFKTKLGSHVEDASFEMNITMRDLNTFYTGFDYPQVNLKNGARYSTGHFLLDKLTDKRNLHLVTQAEVWKLNFRGDYEATSVVAISPKTSVTKEIRARHGIILSAGVINTPKILQLSGIGDPEHLKSLGISTVVNSPEVGKNLQDHIGAGLDLVTLDTSLELNALSFINPFTLLKYITAGKGPMTTAACEGLIVGHLDCLMAGVSNGGDFETCDRDIRHTAPDFQMMALPLGMTADFGAHLYTIFGIKDSVYKEHYAGIHGKQVILMLALNLHPKSKGYVRIISNDPQQPPLVNPNYLEHPDDIEVILRGLRFIQQVLRTSAFKKLGAKFDDRPFPDCQVHHFDSDEYWKCFIRHTTLTIYHPIGTATLGTVLDYNFRVKGTNKLFVADASALPNLPSGNPNAVIAALAEYASDFIKFELALSKGVCNIKEVFLQIKPIFYF